MRSRSKQGNRRPHFGLIDSRNAKRTAGTHFSKQQPIRDIAKAQKRILNYQAYIAMCLFEQDTLRKSKAVGFRLEKPVMDKIMRDAYRSAA